MAIGPIDVTSHDACWSSNNSDSTKSIKRDLVGMLGYNVQVDTVGDKLDTLMLRVYDA